MRGLIIKSGGGLISSVPIDIVRAISKERRTIRVILAEEPLASDSRGANDVLNPANWDVFITTPIQGSNQFEPVWAYNPVTVLNVNSVRGESVHFDIQVDEDFPFQQEYNVRMSGDVARASSPLSSSSSLASSPAAFGSFDPACRQSSVPDIYKWFGSAVRTFDTSLDAKKLSSIMQDIYDQTKSLIDCFEDLIDIYKMPIQFLESKMEWLGNPFWSFTSSMTDRQKRLVALNLVKIYRGKGTLQGIRDAIESILGVTLLTFKIYNLDVWELGDNAIEPLTHDGEVYQLGHDIYDPTGTIVGYPLLPINETCRPDEEFLGNAILGSGTPDFYHSIITSTTEKYPVSHVAMIGKTHIGTTSTPAYPLEPSADIDESTLGNEDGRRGYYSYSIFVQGTYDSSQVLALREQISTIAQYMQPANAHLESVMFENDCIPEQPLVLGVHSLDFDWELWE